MAIAQVGGVAFGLARRAFLNFLAMLAGKKMVYFLIGKSVKATDTLVDDHLFAAFKAAEENKPQEMMDAMSDAMDALSGKTGAQKPGKFPRKK